MNVSVSVNATQATEKDELQFVLGELAPHDLQLTGMSAPVGRVGAGATFLGDPLDSCAHSSGLSSWISGAHLALQR